MKVGNLKKIVMGVGAFFVLSLISSVIASIEEEQEIIEWGNIKAIKIREEENTTIDNLAINPDLNTIKMINIIRNCIGVSVITIESNNSNNTQQNIKNKEKGKIYIIEELVKIDTFTIYIEKLNYDLQNKKDINNNQIMEDIEEKKFYDFILDDNVEFLVEKEVESFVIYGVCSLTAQIQKLLCKMLNFIIYKELHFNNCNTSHKDIEENIQREEVQVIEEAQKKSISLYINNVNSLFLNYACKYLLGAYLINRLQIYFINIDDFSIPKFSFAKTYLLYIDHVNFVFNQSLTEALNPDKENYKVNRLLLDLLTTITINPKKNNNCNCISITLDKNFIINSRSIFSLLHEINCKHNISIEFHFDSLKRFAEKKKKMNQILEYMNFNNIVLYISSLQIQDIKFIRFKKWINLGNVKLFILNAYSLEEKTKETMSYCFGNNNLKKYGIIWKEIDLIFPNYIKNKSTPCFMAD